MNARPDRLPRLTALVLSLALCAAALLAVGCGQQETPTAPTAPTTGEAPAKTRVDTFTLAAYAVDSVHLAGSFNNWADQDAAWELALQADGYTWRLVAEVPETLIYYKFVVRKDGDVLWLTDPLSVEVSPDGIHGGPSEWNSVRGRIVTRPSPLPAPVDRTKLVIYEVNLNDFTASGTFAGAVAGLTSGADLEDLGVNAIELMPVTAPSYNGWGYDPVLQAAPNPWMGWPTTFAALVDAAHDRGMAVILDSVLNHMAGSAPLRQLDQFTGEYHFTTTEANPWGLVELNWSDPALREHLLASLSHWVDTYGVDGFRFDYVGGEPYGNWYWLKNELQARYPDLLLIAEDFNYPANSITYGYDAQWGGNHTDAWGGGGNNFNQVMITALTEAGFASRGQTSVEVGAFGPVYNNMWAVANVLSGNSNYAGAAPGDGFSDIKYLESHDENRLVWAVETMGSTGAQQIGGLQKARLGAVLSLTSVGVPMIYNGQEIGSGEYRPASPTEFKIDWANGDADLRAGYRALIELRLAHDALSSENIFFHWRDSNVDNTEYTLVYWRGSTGTAAGAEIVVAANFDHQDHDLTVPFPASGYWIRWDFAPFHQYTELVSGNQLATTLPASSAVMWVRGDSSTGVPLTD